MASDLEAAKPIYAIVTLRSEKEVYGGIAPVFYVKSDEEQERLAVWISRIANVAVHDLQDGTWLLIPI